jgi:signal transduction histidine kinase
MVTAADGVFLYNSAAKTSKPLLLHLTTNEGMPSNTCRGLSIEPNGLHAWVATDHGLVRLTFKSKSFDMPSMSVFAPENGGPTSVGSMDAGGNPCWHAESRQFFLPIGQHLFAWKPSQVTAGLLLPQVFFTAISSGDKRFPLGPSLESNPITLPYPLNALSFDFAALDFEGGGQANYAYRLIAEPGWWSSWWGWSGNAWQTAGDTTPWQSVGRRASASLAGLAPGRYTIEVMARSGANLASAKPARLPVVVMAAWWSTPLARVAWVLLAVGAVLALSQYRLRQRLALERMRLRIAQDLHDDVGSTLASISLLSAVAAKQAAKAARLSSNRLAEVNGGGERDLGFSEVDANGELLTRSPVDNQPNSPNSTLNTLERIADQAQKSLDNMGDIVWSIQPQNDSLSQLLARMRSFAADVLEPAGIAFTFQAPNDASRLPLGVAQRRDLYLLYKEALANVGKYSRAHHVFITLSTLPNDSRKLVMTIEDDGQGFERHALPRENGLANMERRAAALGGKLLITSAVGRGTRVHFEG